MIAPNNVTCSCDPLLSNGIPVVGVHIARVLTRVLGAVRRYILKRRRYLRERTLGVRDRYNGALRDLVKPIVRVRPLRYALLPGVITA